jgi:hypothetical protein
VPSSELFQSPYEPGEGEYAVTVRRGSELMAEWAGYADNPSDALHRAVAAREDSFSVEVSDA